MALMYMDLDRFKQINDLNGHHAGDELLQAFAKRLSHTMRRPTSSHGSVATSSRS